MILFSLWNQNPIPPAYQACLDSWAPYGLQLIRGDSGEQPGMIWSDNERVRIIAQEWLDDDVMYVDADCMPGPAFSTYKSDRPAFGTMRGGDYDIWASYRPVCQTALFEALYATRDQYSQIGWYKHLLDTKYRGGINRIPGYPDDKYIKHLNLSLSINSTPN